MEHIETWGETLKLCKQSGAQHIAILAKILNTLRSMGWEYKTNLF